MTSFGDELVELVDELREDFQSLVLWRRRVLTEDEVGVVTEDTPVEYDNLPAFVTGPKTVRFEGDDVATMVDATVFLPQKDLPWAANATTGERVVEIIDEVEIQTGYPLRVLRTAMVSGPGGAGRAVVIGHRVWLVR